MNIKLDDVYLDNKRLVFADYTASGRILPQIENYMTKEIYPYYSNTHSNASCGIMMKNKIKQVKEYMKKVYKLSNDHKILFCGNGATAAINHLVYSLDFTRFKSISIYYSVYEHYSNHLPWFELSNRYPNITVKLKLVPLDSSFMIDYSFVEKELVNDKADLKIITITGCSNVTGVITPLSEFIKLKNKYSTYLFVDMATGAPYLPVDCSQLDAVFISGHKFIGGPGTPGILIAKKCLFMNTVPHEPGGGCVKKATCTKVQYDNDLETRESSGTPDILGIIKFGKVLEIQQNSLNYIIKHEDSISRFVYHVMNQFEKNYSNFKVICNTVDYVSRLPIVSFVITNLHYNLIVAILNDKFGVQTRGGISCCGMLGEFIEQKYGARGWTRISFHWLMSRDDIIFILNALRYTILNGTKYIDQYTYDSNTNLFTKK